MLKPKIIELIENSLSNEAIHKITGASEDWIIDVRKQYNKAVPPDKRKTSTIRIEPRPNTDSKIVYDYMILYPNATLSETVSDTGLPRSLCGRVRHRYFSPKAKEKRIKHGFTDYLPASSIDI